MNTPLPQYSPEDRATLLGLARQSLRDATQLGQATAHPSDLPEHLTAHKGCFVTLTLAGKLRGCIGNIAADVPLATAVIRNARNAALHDTRFDPVRPAEVEQIHIEVSVLSAPEPLQFQSHDEIPTLLRPHVDGVWFKSGPHRSTFLPQVWEQLPEPVNFLNQLARKAGLGPTAWREPGAEIATYQVEAFEEAL